MRLLAILLVMGLLTLRAGPTGKTSLSPAAQATMAKIAVSMVGTIQSQRPHGYLVATSDGATVFLLTESRYSEGDKITNLTVYPMGNYSYPTNDTGDMQTVKKITDDISLAADYVLAQAVENLGTGLPVLPPLNAPTAAPPQ